MNESVCVCVDAIYINIKRKSKKKSFQIHGLQLQECISYRVYNLPTRKKKKEKTKNNNNEKKIDSNQIHNIEPLSKWVYI